MPKVVLIRCSMYPVVLELIVALVDEWLDAVVEHLLQNLIAIVVAHRFKPEALGPGRIANDLGTKCLESCFDTYCFELVVCH